MKYLHTGTCDGSTTLRRLLRVAGAVAGRIDRDLESVGLSWAKVMVLRELRLSNAPIPLGQLALRCDCVPSNMTQLVDRLEGDGLVERVAHPTDRRCTQASLTVKGSDALAEAEHIVTALEQTILGTMGEDDTHQFDQALALIEKQI